VPPPSDATRSGTFDPYAELKALTAALDADGIDDRIRAVARRCGFMFEALPMTFADGVTMRRFTKIVDARPLPLGLLLVDDALRPLFDARLRLPWEGGTLQVVSRDGLVVLKTTAGRAQDLVDIQRLMELERGEG
jgi:hypothetical protein